MHTSTVPCNGFSYLLDGRLWVFQQLLYGFNNAIEGDLDFFPSPRDNCIDAVSDSLGIMLSTNYISHGQTDIKTRSIGMLLYCSDIRKLLICNNVFTVYNNKIL